VTESTATPSLTPRRIQAISRALADPRRYEILKHIARGETAPCSALRDVCPITAATLSHHIKELEAAHLVETTRRGKFVDVQFCREVWEAYLAALNKI
jgi:ArsR family transcriptional regulator